MCVVESSLVCYVAGVGLRENGMIKCIINTNGIIFLPVRNIYYYINGMGWDNCCLAPSLLGFCGGKGVQGSSHAT